MSERAPEKRELFHIGENYYTAIHVDEQLDTFPLRLRALKGHLGKLFYVAKRTHKTQFPADSAQVEGPRSSERPILLWDWCSRRFATGVLICAFLGALPFLYSYRGQFGEFLIQLGERLEVRPDTHTVVLLTPAPAPLAQATPRRQVPLSAPVLIPSSPSKNLSSPPPREAAESQADLASAAPSLEPSSLSLKTSLPMSSAVPVANLMSFEPVELVQLEAANRGARGTRNLVTPYTNSSAGKYFDVGKFRDGLRANHVMDELRQHGIHAIIVHSHTLWMNSFHILAGPYSNEGEMEPARRSLESHGFDPRVLQSKSRHFSLPPMTLYGTDLTIRDCIITWELNSPDATIEFIHGRNVVAISKGRWEKRDFAFKTDGIGSRESERGPETLLEIQRAGMDQALVLDGSVLRFYLGKQ
jgi:cell division septation protein DedD